MLVYTILQCFEHRRCIVSQYLEIILRVSAARVNTPYDDKNEAKGYYLLPEKRIALRADKKMNLTTRIIPEKITRRRGITVRNI